MLKPVETSLWTGFVHAASWTSTTLSQNTCLCWGQPTSVMLWWSQCLLRSEKAIWVLQRKWYLSWIGWIVLCVIIWYEKIKHFLDLGRGWLLRSHVSKKTYFNLTNITFIRIQRPVMTSDREAMHWHGFGSIYGAEKCCHDYCTNHDPGLCPLGIEFDPSPYVQ